MSTIKADLDQLRSEISTRPALTPIPVPAPILPAGDIFDLFEEEVMDTTLGKRPAEETKMAEATYKRRKKKDRDDIALATQESILSEALRQERVRQQIGGASSSHIADTTPESFSKGPDTTQ